MYREESEDPKKITYMQIETWEDEESLNKDLESAHVKDFFNNTGHMFNIELKKYSTIWIHYEHYENDFINSEHICK